MVNSLVIHIGLHKTGTTWLQKKIFSREDLGFISPKGTNSLASTAEFVNIDPLMFNGKLAKKRFEPMLEYAYKKELTPVISDERLSSIPEKGIYYLPTIIQRLEEAFGHFRLLLTIREQESILLTLYKQSVRSGSRLTIHEMLGSGNEPDGWQPKLNLDFFCYDRMFNYLAEKLGSKNVCILPLELLLADRVDYLKRLFLFCKVHGGEVDFMKENSGLSPFTSELQRSLNYLIRRNLLGPNQPWTVKLSSSIIYRVDNFIPHWVSAKIKQDWEAAIRARVGNFYIESNKRMSKLTGFDLSTMGYRVAP